MSVAKITVTGDLGMDSYSHGVKGERILEALKAYATSHEGVKYFEGNVALTKNVSGQRQVTRVTPGISMELPLESSEETLRLILELSQGPRHGLPGPRYGLPSDNDSRIILTQRFSYGVSFEFRKSLVLTARGTLPNINGAIVGTPVYELADRLVTEMFDDVKSELEATLSLTQSEVAA